VDVSLEFVITDKLFYLSVLHLLYPNTALPTSEEQQRRWL